MALPAPASRMAAGAAILLLLQLLPVGAAQAPSLPGNPQGAVIAFSVECPTQFLTPIRGTFGSVTCIVRDLTKDSAAQPGNPPALAAVPHLVSLSVANASVPATAGWIVQVSRPDIPIFGGGSEPVTIRVSPTVTVSVATYTFDLVANYTGPAQQTASQVLHFAAQVTRFDQVEIQIGSGKSVQTTGQNSIVSFPIEITNEGVYPDIFNVMAISSEPSVKVSIPGSVYVAPHQTRTVNVTALTPHEKFYDLGTNARIQIRVTSAAGSFTDTRSGSLEIRGFYVANYWVPISIMVLVSAVIVTRRAREAAQIRDLERQKPRPPQRTPRQAVLLAELKRQDKERYQQRVEADKASYKERRIAWLSGYRERRAQDKAEAREAHREFKAARKAQKAQRAAQARERKEARLAAADAAKEERNKTKLLEKKRKTLEDKKAKLDAKQAKIDAKQAKADAKQAALDAKAQAKADMAAAKAAKAEAKKQKKS